ncbi:hypothetical protein GYMLUDRAFT_36522 [Collybiopsis luxurians FD-317 M1]|nr:hypothetical protein GYMLUDRAFT_36522 [Collybiopsis luxurians FD-317 M1]
MASTQSLTDWAQSRFTSLYEGSPTNTDSGPVETETEAESTPNASVLDSQLQSMFTQNAQIFVNHSEPMSVEEFKNHLGQTFGTNKATAEWKECFEVGDRNEETQSQAEGTTGIVAGYLIVTRTLKFRIRATPAKNHTHISLSAKIVHDPEATSSTDQDKRRITQLFFTSVMKAAPIHIQGAVRH